MVLLLSESPLLVVPSNLLTVPIMTLVTVPTLFLGVGIGMLQMFAPQMESIAALCSFFLGVAGFSLELIDVLLNALVSALPPQSSSIGFN